MKIDLITEEHINSIIDLKQFPNFDVNGLNDNEGHQIFTPSFIVKDMINLIGVKNIVDLNKTIFEPASGDGGFSVRILKERLKYIKNDNLYIVNALKAISTIYSIEMDKDLITKQRNNIFSTFMYYLNKNKIRATNDVISLAKRIILCNFIWGETNIRNQLKYKGDSIGWYMPTNDKNRNDENRILFIKWDIYEDLTYNYKCEDVDFGDDIEPEKLGGLFDEW